MTWSRLLTGSLKFKNWIPIEERDKIISLFSRLIEVEVIPANTITSGLGLKYHEPLGEWQFTDLNWQSNVEPREIDQFYDTYKEKFAVFEYDFYYLSEPDKSMHKREIVERKLTEALEVETGMKNKHED